LQGLAEDDRPDHAQRDQNTDAKNSKAVGFSCGDAQASLLAC
jgi:hypothetical protein